MDKDLIDKMMAVDMNKKPIKEDNIPDPGVPGRGLLSNTDGDKTIETAILDMETTVHEGSNLFIEWLGGIGEPPLEISREDINNEVTVNIADEITDSLAEIAKAKGYNIVDAYDDDYSEEERSE